MSDIGELTKLGIQSLKTSEKMGEFLARVFGTSSENAVGIIGDKLEFLRWERQVRMIDKVNEYQNKRGLMRLKPIPPKFAISMITNASLEEDNDLQDLWCKLITNKLDPNFHSQIRYAFIEILKSLTYLDAKILKYCYEISSNNVGREYLTDYVISIDEIEKYIGVDLREEIRISLYNLKRVQCLSDTIMYDTVKNLATALKSSNPEYTINEHYVITPLGMVFIEACIN